LPPFSHGKNGNAPDFAAPPPRLRCGMSTIHPGDPQAFTRLGELIRDINVAMVTSVGLDSALHSRPMITRRLAADDENLWFFTAAESGKTREIAEDHQVNVSYSDPMHQRYVSVSGTAMLDHDREQIQRLWHPMVRTYFPQGPDDPELALLRVQIDAAEYWEAATSRMVQLFELARSLAAGGPGPNVGHQLVDLPGFISRK
jgi:general stress protein 26